MSNSSLVSYTQISPNRTSPRNHKIDTITIHCVVGQCSVETLGSIFAPTSKKASSNYGIGYDGKIGMYVEEKDRSWCSSNGANDNRAITIEVASDTSHPYAVRDVAYKSLINLLVDICQRNDIKELKWKADKSLIGQVDKQNMTVHRWFANKACPGDYLYNLHGQIAKEVNARLGVVTEPKVEEPKKESTETANTSFKEGDIVSIAPDATYYNGKSIPNWVKNQNWIVSEDSVDDRVIINKNVSGTNSINSPVNAKYLTLVKPSFKPFKVRVSIDDLNMRIGPSTSYDRIAFIPKGVYTIVETNGKWGRLKAKQTYKGKSVNAWIHLDYTTKV